MSILSSQISTLSALEKRKLLAELLRQKADSRRSDIPLSYGQQALLYLNRVNPESPAYNAMFVANVRASLDLNALRLAFQSVLDRQAALRTTYGFVDGKFMQRAHDCIKPDFEALDACGWSHDELNARLVEEARRPYDLGSDSTVRLRVFALSSEVSVLMLGVHHIGFDYWSYDIFARELASSYRAARSGSSVPLPPPQRQYSDYVLWQQEMLAGPRGEQLLSYWQRELAGELPILNLPTDRPRTACQTFTGAVFSFDFDPKQLQSLQALARQQNVTLYVLMLAAFQVLLHRYSLQDDVIIGSPMACRDSAEFGDVIGYFANVLPLRANLSNDPPFASFLSQVRGTVLSALEHQDYPFPLIVEKLGLQRDPSRSPLFDVAFSWEKSEHDPHHRGSASPSAGNGSDHLSLDLAFARQLGAPYDLSLLIFQGSKALSGTFLYNTSLFNRDTIARMADNFRILLEGIVSTPERPVSELALLTEGELRRLLCDWNQTCIPYPHDRNVVHLFETQAQCQPERLAVSTETDRLSYADLNLRANQLARYLSRRGVRPESLVGICVERSAEMVIGLLGILKAGGAYVPLDPLYPAERLRFISQDSGARLLLTESAFMGKLCDAGAELICLDREWERIGEENPENLESEVTAKNLAYVIYTSGSTGKPKGVEIEHSGLLNLVYWHKEAYEVTPADRATQLAAQAFDASVWELWPYLTSGASIHIPSEEIRSSPRALLQWLSAEEITLTFLPTPLAEAVLEQEFPRQLCLRALLTGGDRLRRAPQKELPFRLVNHYGPTENTVVATYGDVAPFEQAAPAIGRPIANVEVYVLDQHRNPLPTGVPGRLYVGGASLARGYHNRPELTAERFVPHPFRTEPDERLYDTGDLVRYRPDGQLEFLGRSDEQVKIRGYRIELGEIETALAANSEVEKSAVVAREESAGAARLIAYIVPKQKPGPAISSLRAYLKTSLPEYMIPSAFVLLDALPLSPNGKVDRRALPLPEREQSSTTEAYAPPESNLEQAIAEIWQQALGVEKIGRYDNFFDLGGHSLIVAEIHEAIEQAVQRKVPIVDLFRFPSISALAKHLTAGQSQQPSFQDIHERARQQRIVLASRVQSRSRR